MCDQQEGERNYHLFYEVGSQDISGSVAALLGILGRPALQLRWHQTAIIRQTPRKIKIDKEAVEDQTLSYLSKLSLTWQFGTKSAHYALLPFVSDSNILSALKLHRENPTSFKVSSEALERKSEEGVDFELGGIGTAKWCKMLEDFLKTWVFIWVQALCKTPSGSTAMQGFSDLGNFAYLTRSSCKTLILSWKSEKDIWKIFEFLDTLRLRHQTGERLETVTVTDFGSRNWDVQMTFWIGDSDSWRSKIKKVQTL